MALPSKKMVFYSAIYDKLPIYVFKKDCSMKGTLCLLILEIGFHLKPRIVFLLASFKTDRLFYWSGTAYVFTSQALPLARRTAIFVTGSLIGRNLYQAP